MLSEGPLKVVICQQISLGYILLWLGVVVIFSRFYVIGGVNQENGLMPRLIELQTMALTRAMRAQNEVETLGKVMYNTGIRIPIGVSLKILIDKVDFAIKNENGLSCLIKLGITRSCLIKLGITRAIIKPSIFTHSNPTNTISRRIFSKTFS